MHAQEQLEDGQQSTSVLDVPKEQLLYNDPLLLADVEHSKAKPARSARLYADIAATIQKKLRPCEAPQVSLRMVSGLNFPSHRDLPLNAHTRSMQEGC